jgi:GNAT superfamily N-acetyltransferase
MDILRSGALSTGQKESILRLWNGEYPVQLAFDSLAGFENYLRALSKPLHYIGVKDGNIVAWAFAFDREGERWFAIIVSSTVQRKGYGTTLLQKLKEDNSVLNGWVTDHNNDKKRNGEVYFSPCDFYVKNGFRICEGCRLETEKLSAVKILWQ